MQEDSGEAGSPTHTVEGTEGIVQGEVELDMLLVLRDPPFKSGSGQSGNDGGSSPPLS